MICITNKERIAFCAQIEGTRGEVFAVSRIALQSWCKRVPKEPITMYGHSLPLSPDCLFKIGDRQSEKKLWNRDGRAICNVTRGIDAWAGESRHRNVSDGSDLPHPLWRSHSARTEYCFSDDSCRKTQLMLWKFQLSGRRSDIYRAEPGNCLLDRFSSKLVETNIFRLQDSILPGIEKFSTTNGTIRSVLGKNELSGQRIEICLADAGGFLLEWHSSIWVETIVSQQEDNIFSA
jgi:hypothetical protein